MKLCVKWCMRKKYFPVPGLVDLQTHRKTRSHTSCASHKGELQVSPSALCVHLPQYTCRHSMYVPSTQLHIKLSELHPKTFQTFPRSNIAVICMFCALECCHKITLWPWIFHTKHLEKAQPYQDPRPSNKWKKGLVNGISYSFLQCPTHFCMSCKQQGRLAASKPQPIWLYFWCLFSQAEVGVCVRGWFVISSRHLEVKALVRTATFTPRAGAEWQKMNCMWIETSNWNVHCATHGRKFCVFTSPGTTITLPLMIARIAHWSFQGRASIETTVCCVVVAAGCLWRFQLVILTIVVLFLLLPM